MMFSGDSYGERAYGEHVYTPLDTSAFEAFLAEVNSERCWLLELDAFSLATVGALGGGYGDAGFGELGFSDGAASVAGGVVPQRFSTHGFTSQATDAPASTWYDARLMSGPVVDRQVMGRDGIGGVTTVFSEIVLNNRDGGLDLLTKNYAIDGRRAQVLVGRVNDPRSAFGVVFTGVVQNVVTAQDTLTLHLSDGLKKLDVPIQSTAYAGTGGLEGGTDLKGQPKPLCYGHVFNISPPLVDSAGLVYQVHDGAIADVPNAYDRGVALVKVAGVPAAGQYAVNTAQGTFALGATPAGTVTCDTLGDASGAGYVDKTGDIVLRLLNRAGLFSSEIEPSSFAQLNSDQPAEVGIWTDTQIVTSGQVIDQLLFGIGAFGGFNRQGAFSVGVLNPASGTEKATYTAQDIISIQREPLPAPVEPVVWRTRVGWQKNYTPQQDLAAGVTAARRVFAAEEFRISKKDDSAILSRHLLARDLGPIDGLFAQQVDSDAEAQRLFDLWSAGRAPYRVLTKYKALVRELGQVVVIQHPRHGFAGGKSSRIFGFRVSGSDVELLVLA